ncbi:hypothetical protein Btru_054536 [Bulinus truncatus]|nr:hypothetical protein Btru_054536 [Bulinus truncatus]
MNTILAVFGILLVPFAFSNDGVVRREFRSLNVTCAVDSYVRLIRCLGQDSTTCPVVFNILHKLNMMHNPVQDNGTVISQSSGQCVIVPRDPLGADPGSQQHMNYLCRQLTSFACLSGGDDLYLGPSAGTHYTARNVDGRSNVGCNRRHRLECVYVEEISVVVVMRARHGRVKRESGKTSFDERDPRGRRSSGHSLKDAQSVNYIYATWIVVGWIATSAVSVACVFLRCRNSEESGRSSGQYYNQNYDDARVVNVRSETSQIINHSEAPNISRSRLNDVSLNIHSQPSGPLPDGEGLASAWGSAAQRVIDEGCVMAGRETFSTMNSISADRRGVGERHLNKALTYSSVCHSSTDGDIDFGKTNDYVDMNQSHPLASTFSRKQHDLPSKSLFPSRNNEGCDILDRAASISPVSVSKDQQVGSRILNEHLTSSNISDSPLVAEGAEVEVEDSKNYVDMNLSMERKIASANHPLTRFYSVADSGQPSTDHKGSGTNQPVKKPSLLHSYSTPVCSGTYMNSFINSERDKLQCMQFCEGMRTATEEHNVYAKLREHNRDTNNPYNDDDADRRAELHLCSLEHNDLNKDRTPLPAAFNCRDTVNSSAECYFNVNYPLDTDYAHSDIFNTSDNTGWTNDEDDSELINPVGYSYNCDGQMQVADSVMRQGDVDNPEEYSYSCDGQMRVAGSVLTQSDVDNLENVDDFIDPNEWSVYASKMKRVRELGINMDLRLSAEDVSQNIDMASSNDELYVNSIGEEGITSLSSSHVIAVPNEYVVCAFLRDEKRFIRTIDTYQQSTENLFDNLNSTTGLSNENVTDTNIRNISSPYTSSPNTSSPNTSSPNTSSPNNSSPNTISPNTSSPNTSSPNTSSPNTSSPNTSSPNTRSPNTRSPNTSSPNTSSPNTSSPNTRSPNTSSPNTRSLNISSPNTISPNTSSPNTRSSNTSSPNTRSPNTRSPNTSSANTSSVHHNTIRVTSRFNRNTTSPDTIDPHTRSPDTLSHNTGFSRSNSLITNVMTDNPGSNNTGFSSSNSLIPNVMTDNPGSHNTGFSSSNSSIPNTVTDNPGACFFSNERGSTNGMFDLIQSYITEAQEQDALSSENKPGRSNT